MPYGGQKNKPTAPDAFVLEVRDGAFLFPSAQCQQRYLRGLNGPNFPTGVRSVTTERRPEYIRTHA
jgi:hypothetical protein